jgi:hypothetical protein
MMKNVKLLLVSFLLSSAFLPVLRAQDTEFWFVAPDITEDIANSRLDIPTFLVVSNSTYQEATVTFTFYNGGAIQTETHAVPAGGLYKRDFGSASEIAKIENPRSTQPERSSQRRQRRLRLSVGA